MKKAFTLVELAIVLVIIGLLTAGVVGGQSLIESAKINGVVKDYTKYKTAVAAFQLEYDALPGDMKNATDYWGAVGSGCTIAAGTGTQTCNGNGDGDLEHDYHTYTIYHEPYRAWQHLANSGIVSGNFTGVPVGSSNWVDGVNAPKGSFESSFWVLKHSIAAVAGVDNGFDSGKPVARNTLIFGKNTAGSSGVRYHTEVLTPKQMKRVDDKIDDGKPFGGFLVDMNSIYSPNCTTGSDLSPDAVYNLTYTQAGCIPHFDLGY